MFLTLFNVCQVSFGGAANSVSAILWQLIINLWSWYGALIFLFILVWIIVEILTRNGNFHYNSKNGFSPYFNCFVGSGTYLLIQTMFFLLLTKIFGGAVYCLFWPVPVHILFFCLTGLFLHKTGFWPYLKRIGKKRNYKKYYKN
jgi:hypothetical protein